MAQLLRDRIFLHWSFFSFSTWLICRSDLCCIPLGLEKGSMFSISLLSPFIRPQTALFPLFCKADWPKFKCPQAKYSCINLVFSFPGFRFPPPQIFTLAVPIILSSFRFFKVIFKRNILSNTFHCCQWESWSK